MLTNQDRRAILEQVKASDSGDIIAALRGQVSTEPMQTPAPTQEPVNIPQSPQPIDVDLETTSTLPSNLVDSTAAEPTQLAKTGGFLNMITDPIRKNIAENLQPYGYNNPIKRLFNAARGKKDERRLDSEKFGYHPDYMWWAGDENFQYDTERMDLLNMTMNQPQKFNSIPKAQYKPTMSENPDAEYYRSVVTENAIKKQLREGKLDDGYTFLGGVLGEYKISKGEDEKGKYYSYYDKWDLNPLDHLYANKKINKLVDKVTKAVGVTPPEIYGRVYLDDLEDEQTIGQKRNQEYINEYRANIKRQEKDYFDTYGVEAPKGIFSTNSDYDEKKSGGFQDFPNMIDNEEGAPWEVKKGLRRVESSDGVNMMNSESSATGFYGQLYNEIKDIPLLKNISREEFAADTTLQNTILDMRWRGELQGIPGLKDNAEYLSKRYSDVNKNLTFNEIAAMSNLTGRQGAIDYFRSLRHGTDFKLPGVNKTPSEYIDSYRGAFKKETGGFNFNNTRDFSPQAIKQRQQNRELNVDNLELVGSFAPYLGEAIDAKNTLKSLKQGEYGNAALHAAGFMLPFIPGNALVKGANKLFGKADELIPMATKKVGDYGISKTGFNKYMKYKIPPAKYNTNIVDAPKNTYRAVRNPLRDGEIDLNFMQGTVNPIKGNTPITTKQLAIDKSLELNPNIYDHGSRYNVGMSTTTNKADVENYFRYRLKDHTDGYYKTRKGINPYMKGITKWDLTYGLNPNQKLLNSSDYRVFMGEQAKKGISGTKIQAGILEDLGYTGVKKFPDSDELQFLDPKKSLFLKNIKQVDNFKTGGKIKGSDGRACWDGYRYAGTENGKDKCVPYEYGGFKKKCKYGCW